MNSSRYTQIDGWFQRSTANGSATPVTGSITYTQLSPLQVVNTGHCLAGKRQVGLAWHISAKRVRTGDFSATTMWLMLPSSIILSALVDRPIIGWRVGSRSRMNESWVGCWLCRCSFDRPCIAGTRTFSATRAPKKPAAPHMKGHAERSIVSQCNGPRTWLFVPSDAFRISMCRWLWVGLKQPAANVVIGLSCNGMRNTGKRVA